MDESRQRQLGEVQLTPLECLYDLVKNQVSWIEFAYSMNDWEVKEILLDGERVCVMANNGPEFHFTTFGKRSFTRGQIRQQVLDPLFALYGYATTKTPINDTRQQRFNERFGFVRTEEDDQYVYYRINQ